MVQSHPSLYRSESEKILGSCAKEQFGLLVLCPWHEQMPWCSLTLHCIEANRRRFWAAAPRNSLVCLSCVRGTNRCHGAVSPFIVSKRIGEDSGQLRQGTVWFACPVSVARTDAMVQSHPSLYRSESEKILGSCAK